MFWPDFDSLRDEDGDALHRGRRLKVQVAAQKRTPVFLLLLPFTRWQPSQVFVSFALYSKALRSFKNQVLHKRRTVLHQ